MSFFKARIEAMEGWQDRVMSKLAVAGGTGVVVGSILAVLNNAPLVRHTATSTASYVIVMGCFSALQETSRFVRGVDTPMNGALAGAGTGVFLFQLHGGHPVTGAAICAVIGGAAHWVGSRVDMSKGLRGALISLDLLDDDSPADVPATSPAVAATASKVSDAEESRGWWARLKPYMPIRKFSDEEWEAYKLQQDEMQLKRIKAALEGGMPVFVDKQQHGQQQQQKGQEERPPPKAQ